MPPPIRRTGQIFRQLFVLNDAQSRWAFAVRAAFCTAVPVLIGWAAGDVTSGLVATIGAFTSLYGSGRPYINRGAHLGVIAMCFSLAVALGNWTAEISWLGVLTVSLIAMAAVLVCNALTVGPPGAYMFVLACAAGVGVAAEHLPSWHIGLLVAAGGAFAWIVHMSGALINFRGPEKSAVAAAAEGVARFLDAIGSPDEDSARRKAAAALHQSWNVLVTFQPVNPRPNSTLRQLRVNNHELHLLFARAMSAAADHQPLPTDAARRARRLVFLAGRPVIFDRTTDGDETPLGRPSTWELLRDALTPGSPTLYVVARAGIAVALAGFVASALGVEHAYWAMSAAVLVLHQGFDWVRTLQRGVERMIGTWVGLLLAGLVLTLHPQGLWLVLVIAALQFTIEMLIVRNYALAAVFITPTALTIVSGGRPVSDVAGLLFARGTDTLIGCGLALAVYLMVARRRKPLHLPEAVARVVDGVAATSHHLALGAVTTVAARAARRDLQIRAIAMMAAYEAGIAGTARECRSAEQLWPAVAATEELAYRTLESCWATERIGSAEAARSVGSTLFGPDGADRFAEALGELAAVIRGGPTPPELDHLPRFAAAELATLRDSLVRETD
jgi:uncharacterized membrane protein YccC